MKREICYRTLLIIAMCMMLLLRPVMTQAQDNGASQENAVEEVVDVGTATAEEQPQGAGLFILLWGLLWVTFVGGVMISRDAFDGGNSIAA